MGTIRILDEHVANKIAAGEVVERPAAVVKELVENSLDAGAETVEVRAQRGGKAFIQVTDDGCGMSQEDAEVCLERHATSKITRAEDIPVIATLGFRGEALPSIAAVSQFSLTTREHATGEGVRISVEGGRNRRVGVGVAPPGTTVVVKNLFFNSPARRKFLHADATEFGHIHSSLVATALAHPRVRVRLLHNDHVVFDLLPASDTMGRIAQLFPKEFCRGLVAVEHTTHALTVTGYVGAPALAKANRSGQLFFVNSRPIKNPSLGLSLRQAYQGLLPQGRFPVAFLFLQIPLKELDVNVHPTKREVRFHNERDLLARLTDVVSQSLRGADIFKELEVSTSRAFPLAAPHHAGGPLLREPPPRYSVPSPGSSRSSESVGIREEAPARGTPTFVPPAPFRLLGQFRGTYLIVEVEGGLWIIDQHAAHERVMFEKVLASFDAGPPEIQFFLTPPILELLPHERAILEEYHEALEAIGFSLAPFGGNSYQVRSMPAYFHSGEVPSLLREFVERKQDNDLGSLAEDRRAEIAARVACKMKSIKAGETLASAEMEALVSSLLACSSPFTCPHGRPTMIRLTAGELDRQFDRR
ncbi:MAG: DNA mismatch repair endonuclease MutL [Candidatus Methylomirabilales bacterium]